MFPLNRCWLWNLPAPTASELRWQQTQPLAPTFYSATHILTLPQTAPLLEISKAHLFWVGYRRRDWGIKEAFNRIPPGQPLSTFWFMDSCQQITFRSNVFQQQTPHSQSWLNSKEIHVFFLVSTKKHRWVNPSISHRSKKVSASSIDRLFSFGLISNTQRFGVHLPRCTIQPWPQFHSWSPKGNHKPSGFLFPSLRADIRKQEETCQRRIGRLIKFCSSLSLCGPRLGYAFLLNYLYVSTEQCIR